MGYTAKSIKQAEVIKANGETIIRHQWENVTEVVPTVLSDGSRVYSLWIGDVEISCTNYAQAWRLYKQFEDILAKEAVDISR